MLKLEDFNSKKFKLNPSETFQVTGGGIPEVVLSGNTYTTDKELSSGEVECGGDTEFEHTDTCIKY